MSVKNIVIRPRVANLSLTVEEADYAMFMTRHLTMVFRRKNVPTNVLLITEPANRLTEVVSSN